MKRTEKRYAPSTELIEIFLANGFKDYTEELYLEHFKKSVEHGYNPHIMKRALGVSRRNCVMFDYMNMLPYFNNGCSGVEQRYEYTTDELKSVITFFKLPYQTRIALKRGRLSIPELYKKYHFMVSNPKFYKAVGDKKIREAFESVILFPISEVSSLN